MGPAGAEANMDMNLVMISLVFGMIGMGMFMYGKKAGRMVPLGYMRVLNGKGKWKETNLAVFAHRIPSGCRAVT